MIRKLNKRFLSVVAVALLLIAGCKKDNLFETPITPPPIDPIDPVDPPCDRYTFEVDSDSLFFAPSWPASLHIACACDTVDLVTVNPPPGLHFIGWTNDFLFPLTSDHTSLGHTSDTLLFMIFHDSAFSPPDMIAVDFWLHFTDCE